MTSIFDQYEQASQRMKGSMTTSVRPEMSTTGFIHMKLEEEPPIFSKSKVNFSPTDPLTHLAVSSETLVLAMSNNVLLRIDLKHPDSPEEIDIGKYVSHMKISGIFIDPLGEHILVSLASRPPDTQPELYYIARKSVKLKQLSKFKGYEVTAVAWNFRNDSENTTGPILLGTSKGLIFETEIGVDGDRIFQSSLEQYWRQVFDIGKGANTPITGLEFHRVPGSEKYFIIATTPNRLYQFTGYVSNSEERPLFQQVFNNYLNVPEPYQEIMSSLKYSKLQFFYQNARGLPETLAWLTEPGIFFGKIDPSGEAGVDAVIEDYQLLQYPKNSDTSAYATSTNPPPLSFVLTKFHALLLYGDHVKGISLLNEELIFEDYYNEHFGNLINITKDPVKGTIWAFSEKAVYKYKVIKEDRNVWQIYVENGKFDLAKQYCSDNAAHLDQVLIKQAEMYFNNKEYQKSALHYAQTQSSFEEVTLKFLQVWEIEALKSFLKKKLESLRSDDQTQHTMIVIWVIELFLNQLGSLRDSGKEKTEEYAELQAEFDQFLKKNQERVKNNKSTVYSLMSSHGDKENIIRFTQMNKDYERVIQHYMQKNNHSEALKVLKHQNNKELFYQFAPTLMQTIPRQTVEVLIKQGRNLVPSKLIPALVMCDHGENEAQSNEAIQYLEFCVNNLGCKERAIHNYLLSLYARLKPEKLMQYLAAQGQEASMVCYDIHYALRICEERGLTEACVRLSALLGLWEAAVDLALKVNVNLAKQTANMPQNDVELRKKLWLKIAQHVVKEKNDIKQAMQFLQECDLIKIEDILPFFPDFVTIDHFKDAICTSLQEYNQHIQDLKEEMEDATKSAEVIREEIQSFRNRYAFVQGQDRCYICEFPLLTRSFFLFPCGHRFHADCLQDEIVPMLTESKKNRLHDLQRQLASYVSRDDTASVGSATFSTKEQLKADINNVIASECLYCGDIMIKSISKPFIEDEDYERVMKEWE